MKDGSKTQDILDGMITYAATDYEALDLNRLAAFTLRCLQERRIPTTFENVVAAAFRMFPVKFALEGYPRYPDATRVNRALLQLGPKYRNWARGSVQKGFVLTDSGLAEASRAAAVLTGGAPWQARQRHHPPKTMDMSAELKRVERSSLFDKWKREELSTATVLDLVDMLNAYAYTPNKALIWRLDQLEQVTLQEGRQDIVDFFKSLRERFPDRLKDK